MSVQALTWAWEARVGSHAQKLVLLALANRAGFENRASWPSLTTLAHECEIDRRTVMRCLNELEAKGLIVRERRQRANGSNGSTNYILHLVPTHRGTAPLSPPTPGDTTPLPRGTAPLPRGTAPLANKEPISEPKNTNGALKKRDVAPTARPAMAEISQDDRRVRQLRRERVKLIPTGRFTYMVPADKLAAIAA